MKPQIQLLLLKALAGFFLLQAALSSGEVVVCESRRSGQCESAWGNARTAITGAVTTLLAYMVPTEGGGERSSEDGMSDALRKLRRNRDDREA